MTAPPAPAQPLLSLARTVDLQSLAHEHDASASRVLVAGRAVSRVGGDASGKRSESDGYSGRDARAGTSGSARLAFQSREVEGRAKELSGRTAGDVGAFARVLRLVPLG